MLSQLRAVFRFQESGLLLVILVLGVVLTIFSGKVQRPVFETGPDGSRQRVFITNAAGERVPAVAETNRFLNVQNMAQIAKDTSFVAIMAVGMAMVIISGGIDLSVGSIYALASVMGALVLRRYGSEGEASPTLGIFLGCATCIGVSLVCGLFNGGLTVAIGVHPFIITLASMSIFRAIAFIVTNGQSVTDFPEGFQKFVQLKIGNDLSVIPALIMAIVLVVGWIYLARLATGRRVYAIGGNEIAARFSGIRVERVKLSVYLITALTAGVAALVSIGYYGAGGSGDGQGYELNVIAACVVGGTSLNGGKGTALGVVLGALFIQTIDSGIVTVGIPQAWRGVIIGVVIIAAVALEKFNTSLTRRRL
ncbi:MAG TPA: ABC transporter permease [Candidatus Didemnitutus sp.]|nr:ABC transporter permease [Candidatus Didemnitutus sp.]